MGDSPTPASEPEVIGELVRAEENSFRDYLQCHAQYEDAPADRYTRATFPQHVQEDSRTRWQGLNDLLVASIMDRFDISVLMGDENAAVG